MVTKLELFFWRPDAKIQLCSGDLPFSRKVFPLFKIGHKKCPFSILATDFWKKKCHLLLHVKGTFLPLFFKISLHYVVKQVQNPLSSFEIYIIQYLNITKKLKKVTTVY